MGYVYLADAVVVVHFAYVAFVLFGQVLIVVGAFLRWGWIRNLWFRLVHFLSIAFVALEAIFGVTCPLTTWEYQLRLKAGQPAEVGSFIGRWAHDLLFYQGPPWVFTMGYVTFALAVLATLILVPPRWKRPLPPAV
jgi:hypothetical protein